MKTPKPPPPPDPYQTAAAQTNMNRETAAYNNAMASGSTFTPLGSSVFTPRIDPTTGATVYDQTISVSPEVQQLIDLQNQQDLSLGRASQNLLDQVQAAYSRPFDSSGLPSVTAGTAPEDYQRQINAGNLPAAPTDLNIDGPTMAQLVAQLPGLRSAMDTSGLPAMQTSLSTSGLPDLPGAQDLERARQEVSDALYRRQSAYLDPRFSEMERQMETRLKNQGIVQGSEAWNNEMDRLARARAFEYERARDAAIAGGLNELTGLVGIGQGNRAQLFGERLAQGRFANDARSQAFNEAQAAAQMANAARAQGFGEASQMRSMALDEALRRFGAQQSAREQQFGEQSALGEFANAATASRNNDLYRSALLQNQAAQQALMQALAARNQPLNELSAIRSATQVNVPQFSGMAVDRTSPTDLAGLINQNYQNQLDIWNARQQSRNALLSGLMGIGAAYAGRRP